MCGKVDEVEHHHRLVVGRQPELEQVAGFLGRVQDGVHALVLSGLAGIGKTTVWRAGVELGRADGFILLTARSSGAEARLSYVGLSDLLATVEEERFEQLPGPQRRALEVALLRRAPDEVGAEPRAVASGLLSLLRDLAAEAPVLVAVDDAQWLDSATAVALGYALRRQEGAPVCALASVRVDRARPRTFVEAIPAERTVELRLGPLSLASVRAIVQREIGHAPSRPTLVKIVTASGGNPFYAIEIARELDRLGWPATPGPLPVPGELLGLVRARLARLPRRTKHALLLASCLDAPDTDAVDERALARAEHAGIVRIESGGRIRFEHPLLAAAVYESAAEAERRAAHREVAGSIDDPEQQARHLALSASAPDAEVARELVTAARFARARAAPEAAAELLELALRLVPEGSPAVDELRLELAQHLYLASDFGRAASVLDDLRATLDAGDLLARTVLLLAEIDFWRRGESAALTLAEEALAVARDRLVRARCHTAVAGYAGTVDLPKAAAAARAALELLDGRLDGDAGLVAAALGARVRADLFLGEGFDAAAAERPSPRWPTSC